MNILLIGKNKLKFHSAGVPVVIFLISLMVGMVYLTFIFQDKVYYPDTNRYDSLGWSLAQGDGYVEKDNITMQSPPVYPLILSGTYYLFGHGQYPIRIIQIIINALSAVLIYLITKMMFDKKAALWAGMISCFYPSFVIFSVLLLSENIFIFLVLLSVFIWIRALQCPGIRLFILLGITLGLATLTRPTALFIILLVFLSLWVFKQKRILSKVAILTFIFCLVNFPWVLRNYCRYNTFIPTVLGGGSTLYVGAANLEVKCDEQGNPVSSYEEYLQLGEGLNSLEKEAKYRKEALNIISKQPLKYIGTFPDKLLRLYIRPAGYEQFGGKGENVLKKLCFLLIYISILIFCLIGVIKVIKNKLALVCLSMILYFSFIHMFLVSEPRHQFSALPFIVILAARGVSLIKISGLSSKKQESADKNITE